MCWRMNKFERLCRENCRLIIVVSYVVGQFRKIFYTHESRLNRTYLWYHNHCMKVIIFEKYVLNGIQWVVAMFGYEYPPNIEICLDTYPQVKIFETPTLPVSNLMRHLPPEVETLEITYPLPKAETKIFKTLPPNKDLAAVSSLRE